MSKYPDNANQPGWAQFLLAGRPAVQEHIERSDLTQRGIFVRQAMTVTWVKFATYAFSAIWLALFPFAIFLFFFTDLWWLFIIVCLLLFFGFLFALASKEPRELLIARLKTEISQDDVKELVSIVRDMIEQQQAAQARAVDPGPVFVPVANSGAKVTPAPPPLHARTLEARAMYEFVQGAKLKGLSRRSGVCTQDNWQKFTHQLAAVNLIAKNGAGYDWVKSPDEILAMLRPVCQFPDEWQPEERDGLD